MTNLVLSPLNIFPDLKRCLIQNPVEKKRQVVSAIIGDTIIPTPLFSGSNMVTLKGCRFFNVYSHNDFQKCRSPTLTHGKHELYLHSYAWIAWQSSPA
jgi:hypothetical protein